MPEIATETVSLWIVLVSGGLGALAILAQLIVSLVAVGKAKVSPAVEHAPSRLAMLLNEPDIDETKVVYALEEAKLAAAAETARIEERMAAMSLLGRLTAAVPLAIVGILLLAIAAIANGTLAATASIG